MKHKLSDVMDVQMVDVDILICESGEGRATLSDDETMELINWYTEGLCPVCFQSINHTQIICDSCFEDAKTYRELYG